MRPFLLLPFSFSVIHSWKCKDKGRKQWEKGKEERVVGRTSNSERRSGGRRKRKGIPICAENSLPLHDWLGSCGAIWYICGVMGFLEWVISQCRPRTTRGICFKCSFLGSLNLLNQKSLWVPGLCIFISFPFSSSAPYVWRTTDFNEREKLGWRLLRQSNLIPLPTSLSP